MREMKKKSEKSKFTEFQFNYAKISGQFDDFFMAVGYDEITGTYSPFGKATLSHLRFLETGIKYIRIHNIFTGSGGDLRGTIDAGCDPVREIKDGMLKLDWTKLDAVYDVLINNGYIPYVEFGFMPDLLSSSPDDKKNIWKYPPRDYDEWRTLIRETATHLKERYGKKIKDFIWELWNEPNFPPIYFKGKSKDYLKMYDYAVAALYDVFPDGDFKVGGAALCLRWFPFLRKFIKHCLHENNFVTGEIGTKLDFISFHLKGGLYFQTPNLKKIIRNLHKYMKVISEYQKGGKKAKKSGHSAFLSDDVEIHITELDPIVGCDKGIDDNPKLNWRNTEYYAAYIGHIATMLQYIRQEYDYNITLVFSDNLHFSDDAGKIFKGCRNLTTAPFKSSELDQALQETTAIAKPVVKGYQVLNRMKGKVLRKEHPLSLLKDALTALCTTRDDEINLLITNYSSNLNYDEVKKARVIINNIPENVKKADITAFVVDGNRGNTYRLWNDLGKPDELTEAMIEKIRNVEQLIPSEKNVVSINHNNVEVSKTLQPHSLLYFNMLLIK